jgi:hypothetical protein
LELVSIVAGDGEFPLRLLQLLVEAAQPMGRVVSARAGEDLGASVGVA